MITNNQCIIYLKKELYLDLKKKVDKIQSDKNVYLKFGQIKLQGVYYIYLYLYLDQQQLKAEFVDRP